MTLLLLPGSFQCALKCLETLSFFSFNRGVPTFLDGIKAFHSRGVVLLTYKKGLCVSPSFRTSFRSTTTTTTTTTHQLHGPSEKIMLAGEASQPLRHHLGLCIYIRCQLSSHKTPIFHLFPVLSIS